MSPGGHDDPAWGDSRIAPTRDSCGCSGIRPSLIRERDMLPDQSLVPVAAGPPRYEKRELWVGTANWDGGFCHAAPRPQRGTSPRATFSHSAIGIGLQFGTFRPWRAGIEVDWRAHFRTIDEFGGGNHSFSYQSLMPAGAGTTRYARWGCWLVEGFEGHWCLELVPMWSHPHPNPLPKGGASLLLPALRLGFRLCLDCRRGPGGASPPLHFLLPLSAVNSWFGKIRVLGGAHPGSESGTCFRTDAEDDTFSID